MAFRLILRTGFGRGDGRTGPVFLVRSVDRLDFESLPGYKCGEWPVEGHAPLLVPSETSRPVLDRSTMNCEKVLPSASISGSVESHDPYPTPGRRNGVKMLVFGLVQWHRDLAIGLAVSVLFHFGLFMWRSSPPAPPKPVPVEPRPTLDLVKFPKLELEEPDLSQIETVRRQAKPGMNLAPPTQADFPEFVPVDAFVQPVQLPTPAGAKIVATAKIFQGGWGTGDKFQVFDPSMLDKQAVPTVQLRPDYPEALRRLGIEGEALVEFIVDTEGRVRDPHCISATEPDFGLAAVYGVQRWRFRPGQKNGHAVNTRIRAPIVFSLPH